MSNETELRAEVERLKDILKRSVANLDAQLSAKHAEIERLKAELTSACKTVEQEQAIAVQQQQRAESAESREKALREALKRNRRGMLNILEFRKIAGSDRYGALTREEIEGVVAEIDAAISTPAVVKDHLTAQPDSDLTAAYMAGVERGKEQGSPAEPTPEEPYEWMEWSHPGKGVPWRVNVSEFNALLVAGWEIVTISDKFTLLRRAAHLASALAAERRRTAEQKDAELATLRVRVDVAESIAHGLAHPMKSPLCEHAVNWSHSEDGGKHIRCLLCEEKALRTKLSEALVLIHDNGLALNSTDLDDALRQVIQAAIMEADNSKLARSKLSEAERKLVAARKDSERLDKVEAEGWSVCLGRVGWIVQRTMQVVGNIGSGKTLRSALDAARQETPNA